MRQTMKATSKTIKKTSPKSKSNQKPQLILARPKDKSFEAFKAFINNMVKHFNPGAPNDMTEDEWVAAHKEFWDKLDESPKKTTPKKEAVLTREDFFKALDKAIQPVTVKVKPPKKGKKGTSG